MGGWIKQNSVGLQSGGVCRMRHVAKPAIQPLVNVLAGLPNVSLWRPSTSTPGEYHCPARGDSLLSGQQALRLHTALAFRLLGLQMDLRGGCQHHVRRYSARKKEWGCEGCGKNRICGG